jgi:hypothetical protein
MKLNPFIRQKANSSEKEYWTTFNHKVDERLHYDPILHKYYKPMLKYTVYYVYPEINPKTKKAASVLAFFATSWFGVGATDFIVIPELLTDAMYKFNDPETIFVFSKEMSDAAVLNTMLKIFKKTDNTNNFKLYGFTFNEKNPLSAFYRECSNEIVGICCSNAFNHPLVKMLEAEKEKLNL